MDNVTLAAARRFAADTAQIRAFAGCRRAESFACCRGPAGRERRFFPDFVNLSRFQPLLPRPILG